MTLILDTPDQIEQYRRLVILHGLKAEIEWAEKGWPVTTAPTRGRACAAAKRELRKLGGSVPRTRRACLQALYAARERGEW
jgi:hypothetical protein